MLCKSCIVLSNASTEALRDVEASSHIIKLQSFINFPALHCFEILQMLETSPVHIFSGSLTVECAVHPPSKSVAAMPDKALVRSIFLSNLTFANSKFIRWLHCFFLIHSGDLC